MQFLETGCTPSFLVMEYVPGLFGECVWTKIAEYRNKCDAERMLKKLQQHNNTTTNHFKTTKQ